MRQKLENFLNNNSKILKWITASVFIWGLIAHGFMFFNKISYHDDAMNLYAIGVTVSSGRWMLYLMREIAEVLFGSSLYSIPLFNGITSLLLLSVIVFYVVRLLDIKKTMHVVLLSGCLVTFPQITGMFGYMFTAPYYLLGTLLGIMGVYRIRDKKPTALNYVGAVILMACSVGTYQANIAVILSMMVMLLIHDEIVGQQLERNSNTLKMFIIRCIKLVGIALAFLLVYLGLEQLFLYLRGEALNDYQNINTFGMTSFSGYLERIVTAYKEFFWPTVDSGARQAFPFISNAMYKVLILVYIVLMLFPLLDKRKRNISKGRVIFLMIVMPLACNFIFVMCDITNVHAVMIYGCAMFFPCLIMLLEHYDFEIQSRLISFKKIGVFSAVVLLLINICYIRYSNTCYLKAEIVQSQFISYANNLIMRIEETEGYEPDMMVAYVGEDRKLMLDYYMGEDMFYISSNPYNFSSVTNDYAWRQTMALWCGFNPYVINYASEFEKNETVRQMPVYPMNGSIKVVDGVLVVKFADTNY
ncbi:MAG: glucosyltransferase domain-containing protein [Lachnospiraceae bacterium]|nr:glucosyltransferase domain-containing protein [Lachnospiraceae bacterium]